MGLRRMPAISPERGKQRNAEKNPRDADEPPGNDRKSIRRDRRNPAGADITDQRATEIADHFHAGEPSTQVPWNGFIPDRSAKDGADVVPGSGQGQTEQGGIKPRSETQRHECDSPDGGAGNNGRSVTFYFAGPSADDGRSQKACRHRAVE